MAMRSSGRCHHILGPCQRHNHSASQLQVTWYAGTEVLCETAAPEELGDTFCEAVLDPDDTEVAVEVVDEANALGRAMVQLTVVPSEVPVAELIAPVASGVYYSDQKVTFEGLVSDAEDDPEVLVAIWESDIDGVLDVANEPNGSGELLGAEYLSEGEHFLTLTVEDSTGKEDTDNVTLTVDHPTLLRTVRSHRSMAQRVQRMSWSALRPRHRMWMWPRLAHSGLGLRQRRSHWQQHADL